MTGNYCDWCGVRVAGAVGDGCEQPQRVQVWVGLDSASTAAAQLCCDEVCGSCANLARAALGSVLCNLRMSPSLPDRVPTGVSASAVGAGEVEFQVLRGLHEAIEDETGCS